jgi:Werner syndrome ATP-dependent helicase
MRLSNPWGRLRQSSIADHVTLATGGRKESGQEASTSFHCSSAPGDPRVPVGIDFGSKKLGPQRGVRPNGQNLVLFCKSILVFLPQSIPKGSLDTWFAHRDCLVLAVTGSGMFSVMPFSIFCTLLFFPT